VEGKRLAIITCCLDDWGGSEELWARSLECFDAVNIASVTIYKNKINRLHPEFVRLQNRNVVLKELDPDRGLYQKIEGKVNDTILRIGDKVGIIKYQWNKPVARLYEYLKSETPDLVLISQGINFDGLAFANQCLKLQIPYVIVSHKAVDFFWPQQQDRSYMRETLLKAKKCFFVSEHNRTLTEEQFGIRLRNSEVIFNPVKTNVTPVAYPSDLEEYRLACVGRLFVIDKGQDILIRVLAKPKWKARKRIVSFFGTGADRYGLVELAEMLGVKNVFFPGYSGRLVDLWAGHHALILPSRSEGLPLTLIEAMSLGRMAIATSAGGNNEIIQHGTTGFVAEPTENNLDEVMELAWEHRAAWKTMGIKASEHIKKIIPQCPEQKFANFLINSINER